MKQNITIPSAGESITEVDLQEWQVSNGDFVETDQILAELETEKATLELRAPAAGKINLIVESSTTVNVGDVVAEVDTNSTGSTTNKSSETPTSTKASQEETSQTSTPNSIPTKQDITIPSAGESITEVDLQEWQVSNGDFVETDQILAELETEKATLELRAPAAGKINLIVESSTTVNVGDVVAEVDTNSTGSTTDKSSEAPQLASPEVATKTSDLHATPASRKLIQEKELNLNNISPSGRGGRVTKEDVLNSLKHTSTKLENNETLKTSTPTNTVKGSREIVSNKMTRLRKTIANRLVEAQQTAALLTTFNEVDMSQVMEVRKRYKEAFKKKHDTNLGFMSFFVKAACEALADFPIINSMIDGENILEPQYNDIGVAVSTPKGLVVPVIKDAQNLSFDQVEKTIIDFAIKGKKGTLSIDEMTGGTFTITNGGTFGSMLSTPIVNFPQSAILGMHNIVQRPTAVDGEVLIRPIMYVALSYDHRIIDGSEAVRFLVRIKELIEDPYRLLIKV